MNLEHTSLIPEAEELRLYLQLQKSFSAAGLRMNLHCSMLVPLVPDAAVLLASAVIVSLDLVWSLGKDLEWSWPLPALAQC